MAVTLETIRTAMLAANQEGSVAGEHGVDLLARMVLAAIQTAPAPTADPEVAEMVAEWRKYRKVPKIAESGPLDPEKAPPAPSIVPENGEDE